MSPATIPLLAAASAFLIAFCAIPLLKRLAVRLGMVVIPARDRWHWEPKPLLGGAAIAAAFIGAVLIFCSGLMLSGLRPVWLVMGAAMLFVVGLLDDMITLRPRPKFALQLAAVALLAVWGPTFDFFSNHAVNSLLTAFWLLAIANAFNFIDGLDGLAAGIGILAAAALAVIFGMHHQPVAMARSLALAGALAGFLFYNLEPASIFMGDAGALSVGLILGVLSMEASHEGAASVPARPVLPLLLMTVPLLDIMTVTVTRMATGSKVSRRGLDHSHHRLARLGLSDRSVVALMWTLQTMGAACAVALSLVSGHVVVLTLPFVAPLFVLVGLFLMDRSFDSEEPGAFHDLPVLSQLILNLGYKRRIVEVILDAILVTAAYLGSFVLRADFGLPPQMVWSLVYGLPWVLAIAYGAFFVAGIYRGIWRYVGLEDALRFGAGAVLAAGGVALASNFGLVLSSPSIACLFGLLLFNLLAASRMSFRIFMRVIRWLAQPTRRVIIVGADADAEAAVHHLFSRSAGQTAKVVGFLDDDAFKHGKLVRGYPVLGSIADLERVFLEEAFDEILIAQHVVAPAPLAVVQRFARQHSLPMHRFTVDVTEVRVLDGEGPAGNGIGRETTEEHEAPVPVGSPAVTRHGNH